MKMKIITSILAFAITFGASASLTGLFVEKPASLITFAGNGRDNKAQQKILTLLRQDISNGEKRLDNISEVGGFGTPFSAAFVNAYSKAVKQYLKESGNIDDSDLPSDLQTAWRQHMKAWRDYSKFLNEFKDSAEIQKMTANEIFDQLNDRDNAINRTWYKVLAVADEYDADPYESD